MKKYTLLFEEYNNIDNVDEGWKEWLLGGALALSTLGGVKAQQNMAGDKEYIKEPIKTEATSQKGTLSQDAIAKSVDQIIGKTIDHIKAKGGSKIVDLKGKQVLDLGNGIQLEKTINKGPYGDLVSYILYGSDGVAISIKIDNDGGIMFGVDANGILNMHQVDNDNIKKFRDTLEGYYSSNMK